jgi:hypothetical protein
MGSERTEMPRVSELPRAEPSSAEARRSPLAEFARRHTESTTAGPLVVGAANDAAERDADRVADQVVRSLAAPVSDVDGAARAPSGGGHADGGRVRRSVGARSPVVGAEGGSLDIATSTQIERERGGGAPLDADVRSRMESGFGADFGRVRLHTGAQASRLSESMQAQAFTVGSDVFLHDASPQPGTAGGERLLAHELAHTLQQGGGAARQVARLLWDEKTFSAQTREGMLVRDSTAQKAIVKMLADYHRTYPAEKRIGLGVGQIDDAVQRLAQMKGLANAWIAKHTATKFGEEVKDDARLKRRGGMEGFIDACNAEMLTLKHLAAYIQKDREADKDDVDVAIVSPSESYKKVTAHYEGDAASAFRKLGTLIDIAAPLDGDKTSLTIEVKVPIPPGPGYLGFEVSVAAERDDGRVEVSGNLGVTGGATVDVASIGGALGGYIKAKAKTGADAAELLSYALFRRSRQSNLIPREIENILWGGGHSGAFAWTKAEEWSLGVESRILGADDDASVETGGYGKVGAEVELSKIAGLEFSVVGTLGTKIDNASLKKRKGGAGKDNRKSGIVPLYDTAGSRGAQKSVGVGTAGLEITAGGNIGPFSGSLSASLGWSSDGAHGKKTIAFDTFEIGGGFSFEMPMDQLIGGGIGNHIPKLVEFVNKMIRTSAETAEAKSGASKGAAIGAAANAATAVAELAALGPDTWSPFAEAPADVAGAAFSNSTTYSLGVSFDFMEKELSITIDQSKASSVAEKVLDAAGDATDLVKVELERTSRLLKLSYKGGKWTVS